MSNSQNGRGGGTPRLPPLQIDKQFGIEFNFIIINIIVVVSFKDKVNHCC
jgi:hypothetical protein